MRMFVKGLISVLITMMLLPYLAVILVPADAGMAVCFILFFFINPAYSLIIGSYSGRNVAKLWCLPIAVAIFFLFGVYIFFDITEILFLFYAAVYFIISTISMIVTYFIRKQQ